jgi:hypothetical protein
MFNVECIVKLLILKIILSIDAISKALVFIKLEYMFLLYNHNNPWFMSFNVKVLPILSPYHNPNLGLATKAKGL